MNVKPKLFQEVKLKHMVYLLHYMVKIINQNLPFILLSMVDLKLQAGMAEVR